jgi:hypothetical protein
MHLGVARGLSWAVSPHADAPERTVLAAFHGVASAPSTGQRGCGPDPLLHVPAWDLGSGHTFYICIRVAMITPLVQVETGRQIPLAEGLCPM